jgi:AraC family transcriptional regulator, transcriptional activator of pobA
MTDAPQLASRLVRHRNGVPVYQYRTDPDTPPVSVLRFARHDVVEHGRERGQHIHVFPALCYVRSAGVVHVIAAGQVIAPHQAERLDDGVAVFFDPAAVGSDVGSAWPTWRSHPLLFPFVHAQSGGLLIVDVPRARRAAWDAAIGSIEDELAAGREGYRQAALAHLTLLLIDLARLAGDVVGDLRRSGEPLLADVFAIIDERHSEPLSLCDVARDLGITPGHLTTVVRRRTGRTVGDWITERRMAEARRLLSTTDLPIADVARRVGVSDPGYFSRQFRRAHGITARQWRAQSDGLAVGP